MRILNLMFGRGRGGLEQAAADYHEALSSSGQDVLTVTHPHAAIIPQLITHGGSHRTLSQMGEWDIFASQRLRRLAKQIRSELVIAHGNRAIGLALRALKGSIPVVGVAHNYNIRRRFPRCDAVFCITRDLVEEMVHLDIERKKLFYLPNMIHVRSVPKRTQFNSVPVIGTMGRFVEKKGFEIFLQGIKALKEQQVPVRAILGGDGPLKQNLQQMAEDFGIADLVSFPGWVEDKQAFFASLDIFILPSLHEPFGIVLIEAMAAGLPCITTDTEGPCEIIRHDQDAIMIEKARPYQMAKEIIELIEDPERAFMMGYAAHMKTLEKYDIGIVGMQLNQAIAKVMTLE